uniref:ELMO domain-containing protein n=1 Tax=Tetradesmus obliquus TaxID=3088 RepID=A0A383WJC3_TETOB|eukprot:jgi/Sobl393_1/977/SZX77565.1
MSSGPRRRRGAQDGLQESLLGEDYSSSSGPVSVSRPHQQQLIVHQPFSVDAFIRCVVESWLALLRTLSRCLQSLLGGGSGLSLSLVQAERLEELQERLAVPYDGANPAHQEQLRELWGLAFPGQPCEALKTPKWKDMGWQGEDPGTDFRGAGLFGLDNLLYLGTRHPVLFSQLLHKTQGSRSDWEYPFAVAGLNLTFVLSELLGIAGSSPGKLPTTAAGRAFCALLAESDTAFEEVYCAAFALLDRVWLARKASYMQFNAVLKEVRAQLEAALQARPRNIQQLQQRLLAS